MHENVGKDISVEKAPVRGFPVATRLEDFE